MSDTNNNFNENEVQDKVTQKNIELYKRIYTDTDNGRTMMKEASLTENIFILGYIQYALIPKLKEEGEEKAKDLFWFETNLMLFRKIFYDKLVKAEKLYKIMSKTTPNYPFIDKGGAHILVEDANIEEVYKNLSSLRFDVEIVEISGEDLKNEVDEAYRLGLKGIGFSDGIHRPYYMAKESLINMVNLPSNRALINPYTQYSLLTFMQEIKRNVMFEGRQELLGKLQNQLFDALVSGLYIIPTRNENGQSIPPLYDLPNNEGYGLYAFTDKVEMKPFEEANSSEGQTLDVNVKGFEELAAYVKENSIAKICLNPAGDRFEINLSLLDALCRFNKDKMRDDRKKREIWETQDLPKMIVEKKINLIKDLRDAPIFSRKDNDVMLSTFVYDILSRRNTKNEIMQTFFDDPEVQSVYIYDYDFSKVALKVKNNGERQGTFIIPMRYAEDGDAPIADKNICYTNDAALITGNMSNETPTMTLATISNKEGDKYIPVFTSEKEIERVYTKENFRYCISSYADVIASMQSPEVKGIVLNPASMNAIVEKELLNNIYDIEVK